MYTDDFTEEACQRWLAMFFILVDATAWIRDFEDSFIFDQWVLAPENSSRFWEEYPYDGPIQRAPLGSYSPSKGIATYKYV